MLPLILTINLLGGADALTTHYAISHYAAHERWLPAQNPWVLDGMIAGQAVATTLVVRWLDNKQHPRWAKVAGWSFVAVRAGAVAYNLHQMAGR